MVRVAPCPLCLSRGSATAAPAAMVPGFRENVAAKCFKMVESYMFKERHSTLVLAKWLLAAYMQDWGCVMVSGM